MQVQKRMINEVGQIPGVESIGTINETPLGTSGSSTRVYRQGTSDFRPSNSPFGAKYYAMSPGYLGLALVLFPARVATACLGVMGLLAAMLAVTGVFGLAMYSVSKRMREFGIRVALGALPRHVMRSALGRTLILLLAGSAAGLVLGALASRLLAQIVYEATPRDPVVFVGVMLTMTLLGLIAIWIPARRAMGIDPAGLLREE